MCLCKGNFYRIYTHTANPITANSFNSTQHTHKQFTVFDHFDTYKHALITFLVNMMNVDLSMSDSQTGSHEIGTQFTIPGVGRWAFSYR